MAGGNRSVILVRIPAPLKVIVDCYQRDRSLISWNAALTELLETHPEVVSRVELFYTGLSQTSNGEVPPL